VDAHRRRDQESANLRKLIFLLVILAVLAGIVVFGDRLAVHHTESTISSRIESRLPGSHATVSISSSPFLVRLAVSGTVRLIVAHVTGATDGNLHLDSVDMTVHNLKLSRSDLLHGSVHVSSLSSATVTARVSVAEVLRARGYGALSDLGPLVSGVTVPLQAEAGKLQADFGPLAVTFAYSPLIVPCTGSAHINGGEITLTCTTTTVPPAIQTAAA
jgi:LmeA-like phospholipid-binding